MTQRGSRCGDGEGYNTLFDLADNTPPPFTFSWWDKSDSDDAQPTATTRLMQVTARWRTESQQRQQYSRARWQAHFSCQTQPPSVMFSTRKQYWHGHPRSTADGCRWPPASSRQTLISNLSGNTPQDSAHGVRECKNPRPTSSANVPNSPTGKVLLGPTNGTSGAHKAGHGTSTT